jgi:Flp pilus assembly protein TadD
MNDNPEAISQPMSVERLLALGEDAASKEDWNLARTSFERARALDPGSWKAVQGLGVVSFWQQRLDEAWELLVEALRMAPHDEDNAANLQEVAAAMGREEEARRLVARAASVEHSPAEETCERGETLLGAELWPEAIRVFLEAIDKDAENPRAWSGLGIACFRSNLVNAGRVFFEMAFRIDPRDEDSVLNWSESCGLSKDVVRQTLESARVPQALVAKAMDVAG